MTGAAIKRIILRTIKAAEIPVPPIAEQEVIVEVLDKAFAAIDQAKANIEQNIVNAKELFQSKLNQIFSQKGDGWEETTLKEITSKIGSGATPRGGRAAYKKSGISLIRSMNIYDDGFRPDKLAFIDEAQAEKLKNVIVEERDVLLNITGASIARCCIVDKAFLPARVNQHVSIIRLIDNTLDHSFLHYHLISKTTKNALLEIGAQGATRQAITKTQIQDFCIRYPNSPETQSLMANECKQAEAIVAELISTYQTKLTSLEELKKSILQKAFVGELT